MIAPLLSAGALERTDIPKDVPDYFVEQLFFPVRRGNGLRAARSSRAGGWAAVDRLWKTLPLSTSEILHDGGELRAGREPAPGQRRLARPDRLPASSTRTRSGSGRSASCCAEGSRKARGGPRRRRAGAATASLLLRPGEVDRVPLDGARCPTAPGPRSGLVKRPSQGAHRPQARRDGQTAPAPDVIVAFGYEKPPARPDPPTRERLTTTGITTNIWIASKTPCATMHGRTLR